VDIASDFALGLAPDVPAEVAAGVALVGAVPFGDVFGGAAVALAALSAAGAGVGAAAPTSLAAGAVRPAGLSGE
jgi:hypothetical protein